MAFAAYCRPVWLPSSLTTACVVRPPCLYWHKSISLQASQARAARHQAPDSRYSAGDLDAARKWKQAFSISQLPKGKTSFSRSGGPGGQHVNKTETKATTMWSVIQLEQLCPKLMHGGLRESKYFAKRSDTLVFHAEEHRSRAANQDDNRRKLFEELERIYKMSVPAEQSIEKAKKYDELAKKASEARLRSKRFASAKKRSRKAGGGGGIDY